MNGREMIPSERQIPAYERSAAAIVLPVALVIGLVIVVFAIVVISLVFILTAIFHPHQVSGMVAGALETLKSWVTNIAAFVFLCGVATLAFKFAGVLSAFAKAFRDIVDAFGQFRRNDVLHADEHSVIVDSRSDVQVTPLTKEREIAERRIIQAEGGSSAQPLEEHTDDAALPRASQILGKRRHHPASLSVMPLRDVDDEGVG